MSTVRMSAARRVAPIDHVGGRRGGPGPGGRAGAAGTAARPRTPRGPYRCDRRAVPRPRRVLDEPGLEDQAVLHAIAGTGARIDVFTLDTGRHFPETLETLAASERRYGIGIRVLAPEADAVEALVARDGLFGFRLDRGAQSLLRGAQGAAPHEGAARRQRLDHRPAPWAVLGPRRGSVRRLGRRPRPR